MGFRFQKRIDIFKGLTHKMCKSGTSWTVSREGRTRNILLPTVRFAQWLRLE